MWINKIPTYLPTFKSERNESFGSRRGQASDKLAISLLTASQILKKTEDFSIRKSKILPENSGGGAVRKEILTGQYDRFIVFLRKKQMTLASANNRDTVPLKGLTLINVCSVFICRHCSNSFWNSAADNQRTFCCNNLWQNNFWSNWYTFFFWN